MMEQTQKMKIDPTKPWPFPVVLGVDNRRLPDLNDKYRQNQTKCSLKLTKKRKCKQLDTFEDCEEALF